MKLLLQKYYFLYAYAHVVSWGLNLTFEKHIAAQCVLRRALSPVSHFGCSGSVWQETDSGVLFRLTVAMPGVRMRAQPQGSHVQLWVLTEKIILAMTGIMGLLDVMCLCNLASLCADSRAENRMNVEREKKMKWKKESKLEYLFSDFSLKPHGPPASKISLPSF